MLYDTLTYNGVEKPFLDWGFGAGSVKDKLVDRAADEFSGTIVNASIGTEQTTPTFPFEAQIVVRVNRSVGSSSPNGSLQGAPVCFTGGTISFQGKRVGQPLKASSSGQGVSYKFKGAWYDLENTQYIQSFIGGNNVTYYIPETVLNSFVQYFNSGGIEKYWGNISCGDQIQAILQTLLDTYALQGLPAPFQFVGHDVGSTPTATFNLGLNAVYYSWPMTGTPTISRSLFSLYFPTHITKPISCADSVIKCLELSPRASVWFDYRTMPPTLNITMPEDKPSVVYPLWDGITHKSLSISRRDDLVARAVRIIYRITNTVDRGDGKGAQQYIDYAVDKWGKNGWNNGQDPDVGLRVFNELIDLQGMSSNYVKAFLYTSPVYSATGKNAAITGGGIGDHLLRRNWWTSKDGGEDAKLKDYRFRFQDAAGVSGTGPTTLPGGTLVAGTTLPDAVITETVSNSDGTTTEMTWTVAQLAAAGFCDKYGNAVINRVVQGTVANWMVRNDGQAVVSKKVRLTAQATCCEYNIIGSGEDDITTGKRGAVHQPKQFHSNIIITNAASGNYSALQSSEGGEFYFLGAGGIAQYLYQHMAAKQYDGDAVHVGAAFPDSADAKFLTLGNALNLSNGAAEWATMNAQIQSIERDYFHHVQTVQIGVAKHLNADQLFSLTNMWHWRRNWYNPLMRAGQSGSASGQQIAHDTGQANTTSGLGDQGARQFLDYTTPPSSDYTKDGKVGGAINNDPALVTKMLQATTPTPVDPNVDPKIVQPIELIVTCGNGQGGFAPVMAGGIYTKPVTT
jgi:hypothetical protein